MAKLSTCPKHAKKPQKHYIRACYWDEIWGKNSKKKFFDMLFGHAQRSQKTCCIRFKANINPQYPVLAIFNSCGMCTSKYNGNILIFKAGAVACTVIPASGRLSYEDGVRLCKVLALSTL